MDIEERLKQSQASLKKVRNTMSALGSLGQGDNRLNEYAVRLDERIKVYREILEGKTAVENNIPESLYRLRESYQVQHNANSK